MPRWHLARHLFLEFGGLTIWPQAISLLIACIIDAPAVGDIIHYFLAHRDRRPYLLILSRCADYYRDC